MKKLDSLETLRGSISDYSNISNQIVEKKKELQALKTKINDEKIRVDQISNRTQELNKIISDHDEK